MAELFSNLITLVVYVLQALGFYTIAQRRGIRHAWLAWIPFGSAWILGAISDDFRTRCTGKKHNLRVAMVILSVVLAVLSVAVMMTSLLTLSTVLTEKEMEDFVAVTIGGETDLYTPSQEEMITSLMEKLETGLDDVAMEKMLTYTLLLLLAVLLLGALAIAATVIECICMYNLFESCDPSTKLLYFLVGLFAGLWSIFVFMVRNKDLGLPQGLPGGFEQTPPHEPWAH